MTDIILLTLLFISNTLAACPKKTHLFITAPAQMEALSGSCLQIPCHFSTAGPYQFDSTRSVFGVWFKHQKVIYSSSWTVNTSPMNITGNLKEKNCTTLFSSLTTSYTDTYYFRIMNWPYRATAVCDPLQITITDSPWRPRIETPDDLKEKQSVNITCSAFTPCPHSPPQLTWNLQQNFPKIEENADGTFTTKIQQTITLSDTHDGNTISCSARYPVNEGNNTKTAETEVTLNVSYAPKNTSASISPSASVSAGSWVNLTCSSRAKPPVSNFTWFKKTTDGPVRVSEGDIYSFLATDAGVYYCVATNDLGNQTSAEIHVTIKGEQQGICFMSWRLLGGIIGIIMLLILLCFIVFVCWLKSKHQTQQQTQCQRCKELSVEETASKTKEEEENIHYGEISFSTLEYKPSSDSVQGSSKQEDTVYAQVKVN